MAKRTYRQYCPVAEALDVVGERWTLLIVRELLFGPKRYGELRAALPGMASNLLGDRLAELVELGVVDRRELDGSPTRAVYDLTPAGRELEGVIASLARWGMQRLSPPAADTRVQPAVAIRAALLAYVRPRRAGARRRTYEIVLDGEIFTLTVADGRGSYVVGPPVREVPDLTLTGSAAALMELRLAGVGFDQALAAGMLAVAAEPSEVDDFRAIFAIDQPASAATEPQLASTSTPRPGR